MPDGEVLYVIQHRDWSGAETSQAAVIAADPTALVACPSGSETERFALGLGAEVVDLPFRSLRHSAGTVELGRSAIRGLGSARDLRRILRAHPRRGTIYAIGIRPALLASLASLGLGRSVVWAVTDRLPPRPLAGLVRLLARLRATRALCLSSYIRADLVGRSRVLAGTAVVVNPGVDPQRFEAAASQPGIPVAALVGFISPIKHTDLGLDVAGLVARERPGFRLRIMGSAQFREEHVGFEERLRARVEADASLSDAVEFAGRQADVPAALRACGLLLHCRPDEPFGMVVLEAMAQGLPVVAPAAGGIAEIVEDGVTGLLYPPGDAPAAARQIVRLLDHRDLAERLGAAARARIEERFTAARQVSETRAQLDSLSG
jgi:glycosyltransferase involved in cell wall biosynthesis